MKKLFAILLSIVLTVQLAVPAWAVGGEEQPETVPDGYTETDPTPEPTAEPTAEPIVEPTAEPTVESTAEPTADPTAEPIAEPAAQPVRVRFACTPEELTLAVYPAEGDVDSLILPEEDGSYLLMPGTYVYLAAAEGYETAEGSFTVEETVEEPTVEVVLTAAAEEPAAEDEIALLSVTASGTCGDNLTWTFSSTGTLTISGTGDMVDNPSWNGNESKIRSLIIKSGVTSIGESAFECCDSLTSVTLPEGLTRIGKYAFQSCGSLRNVNLPKSLTVIENSAFCECSSLEKVVIPEGVMSIGVGAFSYCTGLTSITIPEGVTSIGNYAFSHCTGLTSITIPEGVTSIAFNAFSNCTELTNIVIPKSVKSIKNEAFEGCSSLTAITVAEGNSVYHSAGNCIIETAGKQLVLGCKSSVIPTDGSVTSIGFLAFSHCTGLTSITIPEGVTSIGTSAFSHCTGLTSITIPEGVTSIGNCAFSTCTGLTNIVIPKSVKSIVICAFEGCSSLTAITVAEGNSVYHSAGNCIIETAGKQLVLGCKSSVIPTDGSVTSIGSSAFSGCTGLTSITIPEGVTSIAYNAFSTCTGLTNIVIPKSVKSIENYAFKGCSRLADVYYGGSEKDWNKINIGTNNDTLLKAAKHYAFSGSGKCGDNLFWTLDYDGTLVITGTGAMYNFSGDIYDWDSHAKEIKTVRIEEGTTSIGNWAFSSCFYLTDVTIPAGVKSIGNYAFSNTKALTDITIPEGVESIGVYAFECSKLTSLTLPSSVTSIGVGAFIDNKNLTNLEILGSITSMGRGAFQNCPKLTSVTIAEGTTVIGEGAFNECIALSTVIIPKSVTSMGSYAFGGCTALEGVYISDMAAWCGIEFNTSSSNPLYQAHNLYLNGELVTDLVIPDSVTGIGNYTFDGGTGFKSVTIPESVTSIGSYTFYDCTGLTDVYYSSCSETKWNSISIKSGNDNLKNATVHYSEHRWDEGVVTTPATCTEDGEKTYTCSACNETKTETLEKLGHLFGEEEVIELATCTEPGVRGARCQHEGCNEIENRTEIPASGHQWDEGVVTTPATCTEDGEKTYTCSACNETKTEALEKLGHLFGAVEVIQAPTCTEPGVRGARCQHEGCSEIENRTEIPAAGHKWGEGVVTTPATCTEDGVKTYTCSACNETKTETIKAAGHKWGEGVVTTPATCTEDGVKTYACSACSKTKTETLEKLGHLFGAEEVIQAPTCTEPGVRGARCQHEGCSEIANRTEIPASGHRWDEGVVTTPATRTEEGEKTFTCSVCQTTRTETIPTLTPEPGSVDLNDIAKDFDGSAIDMDVDGKTIVPDGKGNYPDLTVPEGAVVLLSVSTYNLPGNADPHTRYPVGMAVYKLTNTGGTVSVERISELDNLLRYAGSSIRITGNKGIRMITGIDSSLKKALIGGGVAGYTLEEYGTVLAWTSESGSGLSLSDGYARHNYAYSRANGKDPVFRYAGDTIQYTNVLVGFSSEQCVDDIAMRPYITLRDADGNTYTVYGGIVNRSIGYIACQNRSAFAPGTSAYNYIWDIIHFVYGDAYDEDYKG